MALKYTWEEYKILPDKKWYLKLNGRNYIDVVRFVLLLSYGRKNCEDIFFAQCSKESSIDMASDTKYLQIQSKKIKISDSKKVYLKEDRNSASTNFTSILSGLNHKKPDLTGLGYINLKGKCRLYRQIVSLLLLGEDRYLSCNIKSLNTLDVMVYDSMSVWCTNSEDKIKNYRRIYTDMTDEFDDYLYLHPFSKSRNKLPKIEEDIVDSIEEIGGILSTEKPIPNGSYPGTRFWLGTGENVEGMTPKEIEDGLINKLWDASGKEKPNTDGKNFDYEWRLLGDAETKQKFKDESIKFWDELALPDEAVEVEGNLITPTRKRLPILLGKLTKSKIHLPNG